MEKYKEVVSRHIANNHGLSGVELVGITFLDEKMTLRVDPTSAKSVDDDKDMPPQVKTEILCVRNILMDIRLSDSNKHLFHMVSKSMSRSHEGLYPKNEEMEHMALQNTASFVMIHLIWKYSIVFDDILTFLTRNLTYFRQTLLSHNPPSMEKKPY